MLIEQIQINNAAGMHARPASIIAEEAAKFDSEIELVFRKKRVSAKSPVPILSLGINFGDQILLIANGIDEAEAIHKIGEMLKNLE